MPDSLYERIGGAGAVEAAVDLFYRKVLTDPDVSDCVDTVWVSEFKGLRQLEIHMEYAARRVMRLMDQWYDLRAGDAIGFDNMSAELPLDPDEKIGMIVVDQFAEAICEVFDVEYEGIDADRGQKLIGVILACISQGLSLIHI